MNTSQVEPCWRCQGAQTVKTTNLEGRTTWDVCPWCMGVGSVPVRTLDDDAKWSAVATRRLVADEPWEGAA